MKKTILCLLVFSSLLAGCIVVPVGRPWHHERAEYVDRGYVPEHGDGWRR